MLTKIHQEGSFTQCAVKSLHNDADLKDRIEFLREASTMEGCRWAEVLFFLCLLVGGCNVFIVLGTGLWDLAWVQINAYFI